MISSGLYTALITPFDASGNLDEEGLRENIALQRKANVTGILIFGSTGEASSLTFEEKKRILALAKEEAKGLSIIAGATGASIKEVLQTLEWLKGEGGVDAALVAPPYYNKPTQEGIFSYFEILSKVSIPLIVYNNKGRVSVNIDPPTLSKISVLENIIGVKESSDDISQLSALMNECKNKKKDFLVFAGEDSASYSLLALGADGMIAVASNVTPSLVQNYVHLALEGDFKKARECYFHLLPLFKAMNFETNPIPVKAAMQLCHLPSGAPRLPLTPLDQKFHPSLQAIVNKLCYAHSTSRIGVAVECV